MLGPCASIRLDRDRHNRTLVPQAKLDGHLAVISLSHVVVWHRGLGRHFPSASSCAGQDVPQNSIHLFSANGLSEDASAVSSFMARLRSQRTHLAHSQEQEGQRPYSIPL